MCTVDSVQYSRPMGNNSKIREMKELKLTLLSVTFGRGGQKSIISVYIYQNPITFSVRDMNMNIYRLYAKTKVSSIIIKNLSV